MMINVELSPDLRVITDVGVQVEHVVVHFMLEALVDDDL